MTNENGTETRLPAEWEPQAGVQLTWPHEGTDWAPCLDKVEPAFLSIAREISLRERLLIACPSTEALRPRLASAAVEMRHVRLCEAPSNDTWARDHGPVTVFENRTPVLLDFCFNGWGARFSCVLDNSLSQTLYRAGAFGNTAIRTLAFVLEGGSIESDGEGTVLTTSRCLLAPSRNPGFSRDETEGALKTRLGAKRVVWLNHGSLIGDDTDGHIDTLARFCSPDIIVYTACNDTGDPHYVELHAMALELRALRRLDGKPYRLVPLPLPAPCYDSLGDRAPATYANFLIINGAVLVPTYRDPADAAALDTLRGCFPDRQIVGIDCSVVIQQHGAVHCLTMQFPEEVEL